MDLQKDKQEIVVIDIGNGFLGNDQNKFEVLIMNKLKSNLIFNNGFGKGFFLIIVKINLLVRGNIVIVNKN